MKFTYKEDNGYTYFKAIPENEKENYGLRAQGPYVPLTLKNDTLIVNYISNKELHPDIVAAICITAFYPFIHSSATMPFPVSPHFAEGLQMPILPQHHKNNDGVYCASEPITINNINVNLEPYNSGTNTVVAYGGGIDSTSIACLFPEYTLIHSTDLNNKNNSIREFVENNLENQLHIIECNCRSLSKPGGFTTFTNIYITPLIMSADLNIKHIMCGSILSNGKTCFPRFEPRKRNRWEKFYNHIGINVFSPVAGCTELITSKIVTHYKLEKLCLYCEINNGFPCNKCIKCLRKQLQLAYHGTYSDFSLFKSNLLEKRPLHMGHIFLETILTLSRRLSESSDIKLYEKIEELKLEIQDLPQIDTTLFNKIYKKSFNYFPEDLRKKIIGRLTPFADIMSEKEESLLEKWDMRKENFGINNIS